VLGGRRPESGIGREKTVVRRIGKGVKSADGSGSREIRPEPWLIGVFITLGVVLMERIRHDER